MRVAFYYHQEPRLPRDHPYNNPYGAIIAEGLERLGVKVEFVTDYSETFLRENQGRINVLHHHWPHHDYYHNDAAVMERRMRAFVRALELARELGYKLVWTAHNIYPHNRTHWAIDHTCRLELCRLATAVIAHCDLAAEGVRTTFGRRHNLFVIPHPHFIGIYPRSASREQARSILGIPADAFIYGFFGSIQPYKGIEELIESFRRLPDDDAWLVIAGGNSRQPEYLDTIHERADSLPRIVLRTYQRAPSEELTRVMQASDVIVLPFRATTTSGTLMLALSWGRPVIAPALGCLPMTVPPLAGILYDPTASDPLPQAMTELRRMDLVRASDAAVAAARRFDWDEIAAATLRAYQA